MTNNKGEHTDLRNKTTFTRSGDWGLKYNPEVFAPGAKCPNHGCRLYLTDQVGKGICEISGVYFDYDEGPFIAGDQTANMNREYEVKIINGKYQKVPRTMPNFKEGHKLTR